MTISTDCISYSLFCVVSYFAGFKQSIYHCKHQIDVLTGSQLHLSDILYDDTAFSYFTEVTLPFIYYSFANVFLAIPSSLSVAMPLTE